jgi:hypothetical protein
MRVRNSLIAALCGFLLAATFGAAQSTSNATSTEAVPRLVRFGGTVKDDVGHAKTGVVGATFAIYKDQEGGAPLWLETQNVQADNKGNYTALLGSTKVEGLPAELFTSNEARWLGVQIEGQAEQPRVIFVSVPYALKAVDAETLGGKPISAFQLAAPQSENKTAQSVVPTAEQVNEITCSGGTACKTGFVPKFSSNGGPASVNDSIISQSGSTVTVSGQVVGQTGFFRSANNGAIFQATQTNNTSGIAIGGVAEGTSGIGVQGAGVTGVLGQALLNGIGVEGTGGSVGVKGQETIAGGIGVWGEDDATTGVNNGVFGEISSSSSDATAVLGVSNNSAGTTYGVRGINSSSGQFAAGVEGENFATSGQTFGLVGSVSSPNGTGALGLSDGESTTGFHLIGCCSAGVWGDTGSSIFGATALAGTADDARAIYLENNSTHVPTAFMQQDAPGQLALQAGNPGPVSSGFGFCTIDTAGHLFCQNGTSMMASVDSGQRQVELYALQSPQNWFEDFGSGRLTSGTATITLDRTFAQTVDVSSDYHVFLTPVGDCRGLYISQKTATGFEVHELGGGQSNVSFDYRIVALRHGFENVRLADITELVKKLNAPLPKVSPGRRIPLARPPVPIVSEKSTVAGAIPPSQGSK